MIGSSRSNHHDRKGDRPGEPAAMGILMRNLSMTGLCCLALGALTMGTGCADPWCSPVTAPSISIR